jgi:hypothetical protein
MNVSINPFKARVIESYLYDGDTTKECLLDCTVIGASTYFGQPITFHVFVEGKYLYSDLPINSIVHGNPFKNTISEYDIHDLSHINCSTLELDNFTFKNIINEISVYFKNKNKWLLGQYITSFDFYTGNELVHLVKLENGLFALAPNHKINWKGENELADYKKNKTIWKIDK